MNIGARVLELEAPLAARPRAARPAPSAPRGVRPGTTAPRGSGATASCVPKPLDTLSRIARRLVFASLARIADGELTLRDADGDHRFGTRSDLAATITVHDPLLYSRMVLDGTLGAGEAYLEGAWDADDLTGVMRIFARNIGALWQIDSMITRVGAALARAYHALRRNTRLGSKRNIEAHYDLGNSFFELFLDPTMTYSCGYFERPTSTMLEASLAKIDRICRKLNLQPGERLLEIGTGWGALAIHAARHYGVRVTTATLSHEQLSEARARIEAAGLSDRIEVLLCDYRDLEGRFDKIVSVEMIEAVGHDYLPLFFEVCSRLLAPDGLMLIQAITTRDDLYEQSRRDVDFIKRYIFPGSQCPSITAMSAAMRERTNLRLLHLEEMGQHYARTLREWYRAFDDNREAIEALGYDRRFMRMWTYYLNLCEGGFAENYVGLVQMLLGPTGYKGPVPTIA